MGIKKAEKKGIDSTISEYITSINNDHEFKNKILGYIEKKKELIRKFIAIGKSPVQEPTYKLTVLRKWNSYTPVLPSSQRAGANKGGGYFLRIHEYGIVIDPGYNFIENFMNAGFKLDDIDSVLISHAHNDHTVELESIFSLLFKRNDNLAPDEQPKKIKLFVNLGTFKKFAGFFDLSRPSTNYYIEQIIVLNKHQTLTITDGIKVFVSDVKHHEMISSDYAVGFIFEIGDHENKICTIKFTCDTGWSTDIQERNKEIGRSNLEKLDSDDGNVDVLIAHIGSIKENEFDYDCEKTLLDNAGILYKNHLGMIGCLASIFFWKPAIVLLSEFGQEMDAIRHQIAEKFTNESCTNVVATDINFTIDLKTHKIMCFHDRNYYSFGEIKTLLKNSQLFYVNLNKLDPSEAQEVNDMLGENIKVFVDL